MARAIIPNTVNELALTARNAAIKTQSVTSGQSASEEMFTIAILAAERNLKATRDVIQALKRHRAEARSSTVRERQDRASATMAIPA